MENQSHSYPLISIVTVCFNSSKTIRQTIESVLNQTYTNIEYILVDGKSTDNTIAIIEEYAPQFAAKGIVYRWISEPDNGIYDAMNKGITLTIGEWIGIINSDDWYELDACENIANNTENYDVVYGLQRYWQEQQVEKILQIHHSKWLELTMAHSAIFIKKGLYTTYGIFDTNYRLAADFKLCVNLSKQPNIKFKLIEKIVTNFRLGGASANNVYKDSALETIKIQYKYNLFGSLKYYGKLIKIKLRK